MFGIGWTEFILIAVIALLFVGPKHLPEMMQKLGRIVAELKSASRELREQLEVETQDIESPKNIVRDLGRELQKDLPSPYAEAERADRRLRAALDSAVSEVSTEVARPSTEDPACEPRDTSGDPATPSQPSASSDEAPKSPVSKQSDGTDTDPKEPKP